MSGRSDEVGDDAVSSLLYGFSVTSDPWPFQNAVNLNLWRGQMRRTESGPDPSRPEGVGGPRTKMSVDADGVLGQKTHAVVVNSAGQPWHHRTQGLV